MTLHYASDGVQGWQSAISVPASGDSVPTSLKWIVVKVEVGGRILERVLDPLPNQNALFIWDGLDYRGMRLSGQTSMRISVGFVYEALYAAAGIFDLSFGQAGVARALSSRSRQHITLWKRFRKTIRSGAREGAIADGWTLSAHHHVNAWDASTLQKGDGSIVGSNAMIIDTFAGGASITGSGIGGPATDAGLSSPFGVAVDAEGCVYIADYLLHSVLKVDADGIINRVAGTGAAGYSGDGGPATEARLRNPSGVAVDAEGAIFIVDYYSHCIRKVDAYGVITTVAGNGTAGYSGDGGPAAEANLRYPTGVAVDVGGAIYIADRHNNRIRKVDANGVITTVAGDGTAGFSGDGGPAIEAKLRLPRNLAVDAAGNIYIADTGNYRVRKVDARGVITTVAGDGTKEYGANQGDGGLAIEAPIDSPMGVAVDAMGAIYIADMEDNRIRRVDPAGFITTVAGKATSVISSSDGGPATRVYLRSPFDVALDASRNIYIAGVETYLTRIRIPTTYRIRLPGPGR